MREDRAHFTFSGTASLVLEGEAFFESQSEESVSVEEERWTT
jgi:hypothetical protein